jgi:hypothetical protein
MRRRSPRRSSVAATVIVVAAGATNDLPSAVVAVLSVKNTRQPSWNGVGVRAPRIPPLAGSPFET